MLFTLCGRVNSVNTAGMMEEMANRPYHHGALETALVDAAVLAVEEGGIDAIAIRDLSRSIGVSPSAAYRHFPSREHLQARVGQVGRERLGEALISARDAVATTRSAQRRAIERFEAVGRAYVEFAISNPRLFEAAFARCDALPPGPDEPDAWQVLMDGVEEMIDAGAIPPARRADAPLIAWSSVHGLSNILIASTVPPEMAEVTARRAHDRAIDHVLKGVLRSIS